MIYLVLNRLFSFLRKAPKTVTRNKLVLETGRRCYFAVSSSSNDEGGLFAAHREGAAVIGHPVGMQPVRHLKILTT